VCRRVSARVIRVNPTVPPHERVPRESERDSDSTRAASKLEFIIHPGLYRRSLRTIEKRSCAGATARLREYVRPRKRRNVIDELIDTPPAPPASRSRDLRPLHARNKFKLCRRVASAA